jgi:hypothetical protein
MRANLIYHEKRYFEDGSFQEIKICQVPKSKDRPQGLKYSFAYIVNDKRVIGYDNYKHKMDHRHYQNEEYRYKFQGLEKLWLDFINDIEQFREDNP